ncbi:hypothetical protein ADM96_37565 [Burkholderia sp. ST111]|nr:hypothetical protein ADM96_37565 [Burkholderia sp. ST111]
MGLLRGIPGVFQSDLTADSLENTHEIATHVQDQLLKRSASKSAEPLEVHVTVEPGRSIDIESIMNRLNGVAQSKGTRIVLHIEVGAARVAGSGI